MTAHIAKTSPLIYARVAGVLYLSLVPLAFFGFPYGPSHLFVPGNAAATANSITTSDSLFRLGIAINLLGAIVNVFVVLALYRLLKPVSQDMAALMVVLLVLSVPIGMLNELNHLVALVLLSGANYLTQFSTNQLQALVLLFHDLHSYGLDIAQVFWGLWLFPMGYLVFKSGFLPKLIGVLLMIGCFGWLTEFVVTLLVPNLGVNLALLPMFTSWGEVLFPLWLLIKGVNVEQWEKRALTSA